MKIKIEAKTKPQTPRKAVKFNGGQWANCSAGFYNNAMVGGEYEVELETNEQGFNTIVESINPSKPRAVPNGNSETMTKQDWKDKEKFIARTAIMKSVLESPALAEVVKSEGTNLVAEATLLFREMWKVFNENHE